MRLLPIYEEPELDFSRYIKYPEYKRNMHYALEMYFGFVWLSIIEKGKNVFHSSFLSDFVYYHSTVYLETKVRKRSDIIMWALDRTTRMLHLLLQQRDAC